MNAFSYYKAVAIYKKHRHDFLSSEEKREKEQGGEREEKKKKKHETLINVHAKSIEESFVHLF